MKQIALVLVVLAVVGCQPKVEPPRMSREAALKMIADSMIVFPLRVVQFQDANHIVVRDSFMDDLFEYKVEWCQGAERARQLLGLSKDFIILDSTNHKRIGQWKGGKLTIF